MRGSAEAGIVHLRLVVPADLVDRVLRELDSSDAVVNVARMPGSSLKPKGDVITCDVAREEVSVVVAELRRLDVERAGSISIDSVDSIISTAATRAARAAEAEPLAEVDPHSSAQRDAHLLLERGVTARRLHQLSGGNVYADVRSDADPLGQHRLHAGHQQLRSILISVSDR
jgi:hypothetical protein